MAAPKKYYLRKVKDINPLNYRRGNKMEVIDKLHSGIISSNRNISNSIYVNFRNEQVIYFSKTACNKFGFFPDLFVHFINDDNMWLFYVDDDHDGFRLVPQNDIGKVAINDKSLVALFTKRTGFTTPCKFQITELNSKYDGKTLFKIETNKNLDNP